MNLREFPKAEAAAAAAIIFMFLVFLHTREVTAQLLASNADVTRIDAFARIISDMREGVLWMLGLAFGYVGVKRITSKPDVIRAEAEAVTQMRRAVTQPANPE